MKKRILFPKNKQRKFIENSMSQLNLSWKELAQKLKINNSTLSKTYRFEKSRLPFDVFFSVCKLIKKSHHSVLKQYCGKITNEGIINPRKVIGENRKKLNDLRILFSNKDYNLNVIDIKLSNFDKEKNIRVPNKITPLLAEEVGMHLGDGYLSNSKYEFRLKGNKSDERDYYHNFVKGLYKKLFNLDIELREYDSTYGFEIYSKALHNFKAKILELSTGRKDNIKIPEKLMVNDVSILTSFLRGLFDTDGNVYFQSRYGYKNYYPSISIAQKSEKLIKDISSLLKMLGFNPSLYKGKDFHALNIYGVQSLKKFLDLIGFHNPKHLSKIEAWKRAYPKLWWS